MKGGARATVRSIDAYVFDPQNANKGTDRGRAAVRKSLTDVGAARSVVASADDVLLAGNQTVREARAAGIREVVEVETDGGHFNDARQSQSRSRESITALGDASLRFTI